MTNTFTKIEYSQPIGVTQEANVLCINFSNAYNRYIGTSIIVSRKVEQTTFRKFVKLKNKWKYETLFSSSGTEIISNSAYQNIIDIGFMAVPWIIREMKKSDEHWFYALEKITGENPIKEGNIGKIDEMKKDWINWASKFESK